MTGLWCRGTWYKRECKAGGTDTKIMTFCGTQLQEFETAGRKSSQNLLKQSGPSRDEDGQEVRKRLTIFDPSIYQSSLDLGRLIFRNCHGKHPLYV